MPTIEGMGQTEEKNIVEEMASRRNEQVQEQPEQEQKEVKEERDQASNQVNFTA